MGERLNAVGRSRMSNTLATLGLGVVPPLADVGPDGRVAIYSGDADPPPAPPQPDLAEQHPRYVPMAKRKRRVAQFGNVAVEEWPDATGQSTSWLVAPNGKWKLTAGINALIQTEGSIDHTRRATVTRALGGGLLSGVAGAVGATVFAPKATAHDSRILYLIVEGPAWTCIIQGPPEFRNELHTFRSKLLGAVQHLP